MNDPKKDKIRLIEKMFYEGQRIRTKEATKNFLERLDYEKKIDIARRIKLDDYLLDNAGRWDY